MEATNGICEVRWHGRGGQGAISSAKILAHAGFLDGFRGVTSAPSFGAERRGAPVTASTRLSHEPIRVLSRVEHPSLVIVLDDTLLHTENVTEGLREDGWLVVNSGRNPRELEVPAGMHTVVATADATTIAREVGLVVAGNPMVNTPMLGAVARATGLVTMENVAEAIRKVFSPSPAEKNIQAARLTFERTQVLNP
jgi:2-oxoacid:acceptor oxidoreductase gamma subunit (pyruvate/2-ketoisovalerate family)